jgi:hypothetical protein
LEQSTLGIVDRRSLAESSSSPVARDALGRGVAA